MYGGGGSKRQPASGTIRLLTQFAHTRASGTQHECVEVVVALRRCVPKHGVQEVDVVGLCHVACHGGNGLEIAP